MAFELMLAGPDPRGQRVRQAALAAVAGAHVLLVGAAAVHSVWTVVEVVPPRVEIIFRGAVPPMPPLLPKAEPRQVAPGGPSGGGGGQKISKPPQKTPPTDRSQPAQVISALLPAEDTGALLNPNGIGDETGVGPGDGEGPGVTAGPPGPGDNGGQGSEGAEVIAPPAIGDKQCRFCPPPHVPPPLLRVAGQLVLLAKICVRPDGAVDRVSVLKGIAPEVDADAKATIGGWRFSPMSVNGRPVAFCYLSRFSFTLQ